MVNGCAIRIVIVTVVTAVVFFRLARQLGCQLLDFAFGAIERHGLLLMLKRKEERLRLRAITRLRVSRGSEDHSSGEYISFRSE